MNDGKQLIQRIVEENMREATTMSDDIFDHPEIGGGERRASGILTEYLEKDGFDVERGVGGMETAFRAVYRNSDGGPSIGLLCEYDAIEGVGHACAHHLQGPSVVLAAKAVKSACREHPYRLVVYGTPDEEKTGGKILMKENGCFRDIDVALMMHGSPTTTVDVKCMAMKPYMVTFHGRASHAAIAPERGRSALDALVLAFHGVECLREHVLDDTRLHYSVINGGGPSNTVPAEASGEFDVRSYSTSYVLQVTDRLLDIFKGAALMTGTTYEVVELPFYMAKIPVTTLNALLMENAELVGAPSIRSPREKTGSTDFGNVMYDVPGSCIRVSFVPENAASHSREFLDAGKSADAHNAVSVAAKVLAMTAWDLITDPKKLEEVRREFDVRKKETD